MTEILRGIAFGMAGLLIGYLAGRMNRTTTDPVRTRGEETKP